MNKVTISPSDEVMQSLREEKDVRKLKSIPDTAIAILRDYFKMPKSENIVRVQGKKGWIYKARQNRVLHYLLIAVYIFIIFAVFVNIANWQICILNVTYSAIHAPTDYYFLQTYPPSIDGIEVGNANETINFQVHIHANTTITENTPVNIEAEASEGISFAKNISAIGIGFFGANYIKSEQTIFIPNGTSDQYELWTGWAGERLYPNVKTETMLIFGNAVNLGGSNMTVFWSEAGDQPLSIVLEWNNFSVFSSGYTYPFSAIHVYSYADIRAGQIADSELIIVFGVALFGAFEVYPHITGRKND